MDVPGGKQCDQQQSSRFDKKVHSSIYCDALKMASRTYESTGVVMSIGTMTARANISNSLRNLKREGSKTKKAGPNMDQLSIK
jgi:hypothetical protein